MIYKAIFKKRCPICDSQLIHEEKTRTYSCKNSCYELQVNNRENQIFVFGRRFCIWTTAYESDKKRVRIEVDTAIKYWKENDRYLMEILSR